jgi:dTDP-4-amino-4,6-dideoxygalactose transaminase
LALRLRAIRNHGENVVEPLGIADATNIVGFNFRLTELSAAIGIEQLKKVDRLVAEREAIADRLTAAVKGLPGLLPPPVRAGCRHVYYVWTARYDDAATEVSRATIARALNAEGVPIWEGYVKPLYLLPAFQRRIAIGRQGWPFTLTDRTYAKGLCPVAERLYEKEILEFCICSFALSDTEQAGVAHAFEKVFGNLPALKALEKEAGA